MKPKAIITLTRFRDLFTKLANSVDKFEPDTVRRIAVVDAPLAVSIKVGNWEFIPGVQPFVFARNANIGIRAAGPDTDVLLINDDCELVMPVTDRLQKIADQKSIEPIGILSPQVDGGIGNMLQRVGTPNACPSWYVSKERLAFVCVWLPAITRAKIGELDEDFTGYGGDDRDYCLRAQEAGLLLAVTPTVIVRHSRAGSASFLRLIGDRTRCQQMSDMDKLVIEKAAARSAAKEPK